MKRDRHSNDISPTGEETVEREAALQRVNAKFLRRLDMTRVEHAAVIENQPVPFGRHRADASEVIVGAAHVAGFDAMAPDELLCREAFRVAEQHGDFLGGARENIKTRAAETLIPEQIQHRRLNALSG